MRIGSEMGVKVCVIEGHGIDPHFMISASWAIVKVSVTLETGYCGSFASFTNHRQRAVRREKTKRRLDWGSPPIETLSDAS